MMNRFKLELMSTIKSASLIATLVKAEPKAAAFKVSKMIAHCSVITWVAVDISREVYDLFGGDIATYGVLALVIAIYGYMMREAVLETCSKLLPHVMYSKAKRAKSNRLAVVFDRKRATVSFNVDFDGEWIEDILVVTGKASLSAFNFFANSKNVKGGSDITSYRQDSVSTIEMSFN
ncbi:TPA: hypothetical protein I7730_16025 [Vibrio vulnificus]|uniref:Uncharacterized protein n=1 Tax=Vibrio vulnificus TaxID=672 RepID=A0A8H9N1W4_VIBVL|nr:hypothetical protein [Vibrio vulnificus]